MRARPPPDAAPGSRDLRLLTRLWPFVRPYLPQFLAGTGLLALASGTKLVGPYLLKLAIDGPMTRGDLGTLAGYAAAYLLAQLMQGALEAAQVVLIRVRGQDVLADLRGALFAKAQRLPFAYYDATPGGHTLARITSDVAVLADLFSSGIAALLGDLLLLVGILVMLAQLDSQLAWIAYAALPALVMLTELFRRSMRKAYRRTRDLTALLTGRLQEFLGGYEVLRLFAAEPWADREFGAANRHHRDAFLRSVNLHALFFPAVELLSALAVGAAIWTGGGAVLQQRISLGSLVAFLEYLQKFFRPVRDLSDKFNVVQAALAALERIGDFLDLAEPPPGGSERPRFTGQIAFHDLRFGYVPGTPVLRDLQLAVAPGEVTAVVGPTGSGKTTLMHLLLGFYAPWRGRILIDQVDRNAIDPEHFSRHVALVPQDVFLFGGSVLDNIRLGREWISTAQAREAAHITGLEEALTHLPRGLETPLREAGSDLSAGLRQLVACARALAGDPSILVLDEATSEVDQATEARIEQALQHLLAGRTCLVIAHRLGTVRRASQVVVLQDGRIVERGNHHTLLAQGGIYRTLYELQFRRLAA